MYAAPIKKNTAMAETGTQVKVQNRAGECVGTFCDGVSFRKWRGEMQKQLGAKSLAVAIGEEVYDTPGSVAALPEGSYEAILVQKWAIPPGARNQLSGREVFKAI